MLTSTNPDTPGIGTAPAAPLANAAHFIFFLKLSHLILMFDSLELKSE